MSDLKEIHDSTCPNFNSNEPKLQLSCDGIAENKSNSVTIDAYSVCFNNCQNIYPHTFIRPLGKHKMDNINRLRAVVNDITSNGFHISQFVGDSPMRSRASGTKNHASWFPCEYCFGKGVKIELSDNSKGREKIIQQKEVIEEKIKDCQHEPQSLKETQKLPI